MGKYAEFLKVWGHRTWAPEPVTPAQIHTYEVTFGRLLPASYFEQITEMGAAFLSEDLAAWVDDLKERDVDAPQEPISRFLASSELLDSLGWKFEGDKLVPFA